jgi:hypothetical protein
MARGGKRSFSRLDGPKNRDFRRCANQILPGGLWISLRLSLVWVDASLRFDNNAVVINC